MSIYHRYKIREAYQHEKGEILDLIKEHHSMEDPATRAFYLKNKARITLEDEKLIGENSRDFVHDNPCIIAYDLETNKIVGTIVLFNYEITCEADKSKYPTLIPVRQAEITRPLYQVHNDFYKSVGFFDTFLPRRRFSNLRSMCVHADHRGKGLAKAMVKESIEWAKRNDVEVVHSMFTSVAARKVAASAGLIKMAEFDLNVARIECDGELIFGDARPDNVSWMMALEFNKSQ